MLERLLSALVATAIFWLGFTLYHRYHALRIRRNLNQDSLLQRPRLLFFYGSRCAACTQQKHFLSQLAADWQPLIESIHVEEEPEKAQLFNVMTVPMTILIGRDQTVQQINYGLTNSQKLAQQLQKLM